MSFETAWALYKETFPWVRNELERLEELWFLLPDSIPGIFRSAHVPWEKNDFDRDELTARITSRIRDTFFAHPDITPDILASNTAFWVQHLLKNPDRKLRFFDPHCDESKITKVRPNTHIPLPWVKAKALYLGADIFGSLPLLKELFSHSKLDILLWKKFVLNLEAVGNECKMLEERIKKGEKNIFVVTNHLTWANIPFLAFCFHYFLGIPKEQLYALVGPAIFTSEFEFEGARRWMNLILTWPDTLKWDTGYDRADEVQSSALRRTLKIMKDTSEWVRVVFLAPSGTSDTLEGWVCQMASPSEGSLKLMRSVGRNYDMYPIGVNDSEIMDCKWRPRKGEVRVKIGEKIQSQVADSVVIATLPTLIQDKYGKPIGAWRLQNAWEASYARFAEDPFDTRNPS